MRAGCCSGCSATPTHHVAVRPPSAGAHERFVPRRDACLPCMPCHRAPARCRGPATPRVPSSAPLERQACCASRARTGGGSAPPSARELCTFDSIHFAIGRLRTEPSSADDTTGISFINAVSFLFLLHCKNAWRSTWKVEPGWGSRRDLHGTKTLKYFNGSSNEYCGSLPEKMGRMKVSVRT